MKSLQHFTCRMFFAIYYLKKVHKLLCLSSDELNDYTDSSGLRYLFSTEKANKVKGKPNNRFFVMGYNYVLY